MTCNGTSDNTAGMNTLLTAIGGTQAKLVFPSGVKCLLSAISFPATLTLDFSSGGGIKVATGQRVTVLGTISSTTQEIFF